MLVVPAAAVSLTGMPAGNRNGDAALCPLFRLPFPAPKDARNPAGGWAARLASTPEELCRYYNCVSETPRSFFNHLGVKNRITWRQGPWMHCVADATADQLRKWR